MLEDIQSPYRESNKRQRNLKTHRSRNFNLYMLLTKTCWGRAKSLPRPNCNRLSIFVSWIKKKISPQTIPPYYPNFYRATSCLRGVRKDTHQSWALKNSPHMFLARTIIALPEFIPLLLKVFFGIVYPTEHRPASRSSITNGHSQ